MMSRCSVPAVVAADDCKEIMLFGVRVKVDPMRKSVSMNNLSEYERPNQQQLTAAAAPGYASADDAVHHHSAAARERKRGVPWTEEEHKLFLLGLQKVGKGDWRGISRNFVKSRTPTQVASHAQKYFLRRSNLNRRRRRSSLFDITTDSVAAIPMEEEHVDQDSRIQPVVQSPETPKNSSGFSVAPYSVPAQPAVFPIHAENPSGVQMNNASEVLLATVSSLPLLKSPAPCTAVDFNHIFTNEDPTMSLNLSLSFDHQDQLSSRHSACQVVRSFSNGDGMISVV